MHQNFLPMPQSGQNLLFCDFGFLVRYLQFALLLLNLVNKENNSSNDGFRFPDSTIDRND